MSRYTAWFAFDKTKNHSKDTGIYGVAFIIEDTETRQTGRWNNFIVNIHDGCAIDEEYLDRVGVEPSSLKMHGTPEHEVVRWLIEDISHYRGANKLTFASGDAELDSEILRRMFTRAGADYDAFFEKEYLSVKEHARKLQEKNLIEGPDDVPSLHLEIFHTRAQTKPCFMEVSVARMIYLETRKWGLKASHGKV